MIIGKPTGIEDRSIQRLHNFQKIYHKTCVSKFNMKTWFYNNKSTP